jgi:hypothetical protein
MQPLVKTDQTGYQYYFTIYVAGQGTDNLDGDSDFSGKAMGAFSTGVASRAAEGVRDAVLNLQEFLEKYEPEKYEIEKIDVDVFGFSRGAAAARRSIAVMLEWMLEAPSVNSINLPLYKKIKLLGYDDMDEKRVEVTFAGIYDTVLSVNASQLNYWSDAKLSQRAIALATKSVHLCAAEEHRLDFPLHTIRSALKKGKGKEYYLPGVHSDVGGSYNLANNLAAEGDKIEIVRARGSGSVIRDEKEKLIASGIDPTSLRTDVLKQGARNVILDGKLIEMRTVEGTKGEAMRTSSEINRVINFGASPILNIDRDRLIEQGWYKPDEIKVHSFGVGYLQVTRFNIKSAYSNIPLKLMAKFAVENGLEFDAKLNQRANQVLSKEPDLQSLESSINNYIAKMGSDKSKPEDWIEDAKIHHSNPKYPMTNIRHDHLHMSAKTTAFSVTNFGFTPRFTILGKRRRYYYDG